MRYILTLTNSDSRKNRQILLMPHLNINPLNPVREIDDLLMILASDYNLPHLANILASADDPDQAIVYQDTATLLETLDDELAQGPTTGYQGYTYEALPSDATLTCIYQMTVDRRDRLADIKPQSHRIPVPLENQPIPAVLYTLIRPEALQLSIKHIDITLTQAGYTFLSHHVGSHLLTLTYLPPTPADLIHRL